MAITSQTKVMDYSDLTLRVAALEATLNTITDLTATGTITLTGPITIDLTNVPTYADQATAAAALAPGRMFKTTTTGVLGVALT